MAEIFRDPLIQRHSKVAAVRRVYGNKMHFVNYAYNFFKAGGEITPTFFWSENRKIQNKETIFTSLSDFQGYQFKVSPSYISRSHYIYDISIYIYVVCWCCCFVADISCLILVHII